MMGKRILLVDDDWVTLHAHKLLLTQHGYEVHVSQRTSVAIHMLISQQFDLILLDISMPTIDGFDFIKLVKALFIDVPIVFLSGTIDRLTEKKAKYEGVRRCIKKGDNMAHIPAIMSEILGEIEKR